MDRKIVKPAKEGGRIWNPEHNGFIPEAGIEVQMSPYWLGIEARGDIIAEALPEPVPEPEPAAKSEPAAAPVAAKPAAPVAKA